MSTRDNRCPEFGDISSGEPSERLDVHVELRLEDTLLAGFQVFSRRARVVIAVYALAVVGLILFLALKAGSASSTDVGLLAAAVVAALLLPALATALVYRHAKSDFERSAQGVHIIQYHFSPDGVLIETVERPGWFEWDGFEKFLELRSCFLLFANRDEYYVVPKRCLRGAAEIDGLRTILRRWVGSPSGQPNAPRKDVN